MLTYFCMVVFLEFSQGLVLPTKTTSNKVQTTNHNQAEISKVQYMYMQCSRLYRYSGFQISKALICFLLIRICFKGKLSWAVNLKKAAWTFHVWFKAASMQGKTDRIWRAFGGERDDSRQKSRVRERKVARKPGMLPQTNLLKCMHSSWQFPFKLLEFLNCFHDNS